MLHEPTKQMQLAPGDRWLFRWVFEYADGKPRKVGGWFPATRVEDMASTVNKDGLLVALVEGKHFLRKEVRVFAECSGADFINFEHLGACMIGSNGRVRHHVYGMRIQARDHVITCYENGKVKHESRQLADNHRYPEWTRY